MPYEDGALRREALDDDGETSSGGAGEKKFASSRRNLEAAQQLCYRVGSEPRRANARLRGLVLKGGRGAIKAALRRGLAHDLARPQGLAGPCSLTSSRPGHARCLRRRSVVPGCAECISRRHWRSKLEETSEPDHALVLERESLFKEHSRLGP